jgi:Spy/CpxP family protein refolding chaperone
MKTILPLLAGLLLAAAPLHASVRASDHPGSLAILLGLDSVRAELAISKSQAAKLDALRTEYRNEARSIVESSGTTKDSKSEAASALEKITAQSNTDALKVLTPAQAAKLRTIEHRVLGPSLLVSPSVQKQLGLSKEQSASIERIRQNGLLKVSQINHEFEEAKITQAQRIDALRSNRLKVAKGMASVLTPAQAQTLSTLAGSPIKGN